MPFSVLESLGAGRPVCAIHLPQLACVIKDGVSGMLVARSGNEDDMAERLSDAFVQVRARMLAGEITPEAIAHEIRAFTPERQLANVYENHWAVQRRRYGHANMSVASA